MWLEQSEKPAPLDAGQYQRLTASKQTTRFTGGADFAKLKEGRHKETFIQCYNKPGVFGDGAVKGPAGYYFINVPMAVCLPLRICITKKRVA